MRSSRPAGQGSRTRAACPFARSSDDLQGRRRSHRRDGGATRPARRRRPGSPLAAPVRPAARHRARGSRPQAVRPDRNSFLCLLRSGGGRQHGLAVIEQGRPGRRRRHSPAEHAGRVDPAGRSRAASSRFPPGSHEPGSGETTGEHHPRPGEGPRHQRRQYRQADHHRREEEPGNLDRRRLRQRDRTSAGLRRCAQKHPRIPASGPSLSARAWRLPVMAPAGAPIRTPSPAMNPACPATTSLRVPGGAPTAAIVVRSGRMSAAASPVATNVPPSTRTSAAPRSSHIMRGDILLESVLDINVGPRGPPVSRSHSSSSSCWRGGPVRDRVDVHDAGSSPPARRPGRRRPAAPRWRTGDWRPWPRRRGS